MPYERWTYLQPAQPATVLSLLSGHMPADEAASVTDDLEAQVSKDGYGRARTSAGIVTVSRYLDGQLSVRLTDTHDSRGDSFDAASNLRH